MKRHSILIGGIAVAFSSGAALAGPIAPVYIQTFQDALTGPNQFTTTDGGKQAWTITPGADSYQNEFYERPTVQTYKVVDAAGGGERFAAKEYFENLDIDTASYGFDSEFLYVSINMLGLDKITEDGTRTREGLVYEYGFRIGLPADGANGWLFTSDQPLLKNGTTWDTEGNRGYKDTNGDVGGSGAANGLSITKQDNAAAAVGNGYDLNRISDGRIINGANNGSKVLYSRINPGDASVVEFALEYGKLGLTMADLEALQYLDFQSIKGGPKDNQNYLWNDEYTKNEAGSPYRAASGDTSKSEFGTQGLGNIYELDTLRGAGTPIPLPSAAWAGLGLLCALGTIRAWRRSRR